MKVKDVGNFIVEEQSSLIALLRDLHYFWKCALTKSLTIGGVSFLGMAWISNPLSHPNVSTWLGKLPLASKGTNSRAKMLNGARLIMICITFPRPKSSL